MPKDVTEVLRSITNKLIENIENIAEDGTELQGTKISFNKKIDFPNKKDETDETMQGRKKALIINETLTLEISDMGESNFQNIGALKDSLNGGEEDRKEVIIGLTKLISKKLYVSGEETDGVGYKLKTPFSLISENISVEIKTDQILLDLWSDYETNEIIRTNLANKIKETLIDESNTSLDSGTSITIGGKENKITSFSSKESEKSDTLEKLKKELTAGGEAATNKVITEIKKALEEIIK